MIFHKIEDWNAAYANVPNIPGGESWPDKWISEAKAYRDEMSAADKVQLGIAYGDRPRNTFDLFLPADKPKGLVVFVHGGYWIRFDNSYWSHLAKGCVDNGWAVAMPGYTLTPDIRISGITEEIGQAITRAAEIVPGPIRLTGHSAGGHLVTRMISATSPLPDDVRTRIANTVSISGVHDLRPMMATAMNATLNLDETEAIAESPALLRPLPGARLTCWVGAAERAEFIRQNALLANVWTGLGAEIASCEEPDRHHFNVIDGLRDKDHPLTRTLLDA